jgi:hypothetical protein
MNRVSPAGHENWCAIGAHDALLSARRTKRPIVAGRKFVASAIARNQPRRRLTRRGFLHDVCGKSTAAIAPAGGGTPGSHAPTPA